MHQSLIPFVRDEFCYISSHELIEKLKESDNYYYLDDINFLSLQSPEQVICGYFPGCDPTKNFFYAICRRRIIDEESIEILAPSAMIFVCTDFAYLRCFLNIICEKKLPIHTLTINLPCSVNRMAHMDITKTVRENLDILMNKYEKHLSFAKSLIDYRLRRVSDIPSIVHTAKYSIQETSISPAEIVFDVYENDMPIFQYKPNTFSNINSNIPALRQPSEERLGLKAISFSDDIITLSHEKPSNDAIKYCLRVIGKRLIERGYVVKNIALPNEYENEELSCAVGMTRFRQFVSYKTND